MKVENVVESIAVKDLKPHPKNYNHHPEDQVEHIIQSIKENGIYRNVVISQDGYILAGHGVIQAAEKLGMESIHVIRVPIKHDTPQAVKILIGDNEISHLSEKDDRALTDMLKEIKDLDMDLLGTGFDDMMIANLMFVTRPESEVKTLDEAAEWVGMPEYEAGKGAEDTHKLIVAFKNPEDRETFVDRFGIEIDKRESKTWSTRWPFTAREDLSSLLFEVPDEE